ncbi:MAG: ISL3 family transposase, partial [Candidatus Aminicenantia bacterium]
MKVTKFFEEILNLGDSWKVTDLKLDESTNSIKIRIEFIRGSPFQCKECRTFSSSVYDHKEREWRHLSIFQYSCYLVGDIPRIECPKCGTIRQVKVPWADPYMRYTYEFENYILSLLIKMSIKEVEEEASIDWKTVDSILDRAVNRGLERQNLENITKIGIDEVSVRRGHKYFTLVYDLKIEGVIWVGKDRDKHTLKRFFKFFGKRRSKRIEVVCCDIWKPYLHSISRYIPQAEVVFDKFHITKMINMALDQVRREEHKKLQRKRSDILKRTRYIFLKNPENLTEKQEMTFKELERYHLKTVKAYKLKEMFKHIWDYFSIDKALEFFKKWFWMATHSRISHMREIAHILKRHLYGIIAYAKHRITNNYVEGMNNKIKAIARKAYGYRTDRCYRNA